MDFAQMLLDASRSLALRASENNASQLVIGRMIGTDSVQLSDGYVISAPLLHFTPMCSDYVIDVPQPDYPNASHAHGGRTGLVATGHAWTAVSADGIPVMFIPTDVSGAPKREDYGSDKDYYSAYKAWLETISAKLDVSKLDIDHYHPIQDDLPKIRVWRGVKDGDSVLVAKLNTRQFVVLCPLICDNTEEEGSRDHVAITE